MGLTPQQIRQKLEKLAKFDQNWIVTTPGKLSFVGYVTNFHSFPSGGSPINRYGQKYGYSAELE